MTKKLFLSTLILTSTLVTTVHATELNPYVGAGYTYADAGYKGDFDTLAESKHHAGFIAAGVRPNRYWGTEAFYQNAKEESKSFAGIEKTKTDFQSFGLDALGYLPVHDKVDVIGTTGIGHYRFKANLSGLVAGSETETNLGWRIGAGAQYHVTDNLSLRGMVRYVMLNNDSNDAVENLTDISVGVYWHF